MKYYIFLLLFIGSLLLELGGVFAIRLGKDIMKDRVSLLTGPSRCNSTKRQNLPSNQNRRNLETNDAIFISFILNY